MEKLKKNIYEYYKENQEYLMENHYKIECFIAIDYALEEEISENEYNLIADKCINAYLKYGDNDIELINIVDFIVRGINENKIEFNELNELNYYEILNGYLEDTYDFKNKEFTL